MTKGDIDGLLQAEENEAKRLAEKYHVKYLDLGSFELNRELVQSFPVDFLYHYNFVPLEDDGRVLKIAMADPSDLAAIDSIETFFSRKAEVYAASLRAVQEALRRSETATQVLREATEGFIHQVVEKESGEEEDVITIEKLTEQDGSIIKLVNTIIFTAVQKRASDIHIESKENVVRIKFRIDGVLTEAMEPIDRRFQSLIISRIKIMSDLDISE
ncbi:MAG: Flp pilus assembly complex ATPase component TadA, partial [Candidatus Saccharicenans sp.]|nr:Flp pilus assembly complex ATPase component TadA [Candidatus Saccharicenans sp.]